LSRLARTSIKFLARRLRLRVKLFKHEQRFVSHRFEVTNVREPIEAAVERAFKAADADPTIAKDRLARLTPFGEGAHGSQHASL
jgi:hypothetical protein